MKDVSEIISHRLESLKSGFSIEWQSELVAFMKFLRSNPKSKRIIEEIQESKTKDHHFLLIHFQRLLEDGKKSLDCLFKEVKKSSSGSIINAMNDLYSINITQYNILDPFFELDTLFWNYHTEWIEVLRNIINTHEEYSFLSKYALLFNTKVQNAFHLQVILHFSDNIQIGELEASYLAGNRSTAMWGKWDHIL